MKKLHIGLMMALICLASCSEESDFEDVVMSNHYVNATASITISGEGGEADVEIQANCNWTVNTDANWLTIETRSGNGDQTITISAVMNRSNTDRIAYVYVKSGHNAQRKVTVTQGKPKSSTLIPNPDDNLPPS